MISSSCPCLLFRRLRFLARPGWPYLGPYLRLGLERPRRIFVEPFQADPLENLGLSSEAIFPWGTADLDGYSLEFWSWPQLYWLL